MGKLKNLKTITLTFVELISPSILNLVVAKLMMCQCADSLAGVVLAVQCMMKVHRNRNMQHYLEKPTLALARLQQADGSFGSLHGTAFALQVHNIKHKKSSLLQSTSKGLWGFGFIIICT